MFIDTSHRLPRYGCEKLGLLEGPPLRGARTVVQAAADVFDVDFASFVVFDDTSGLAVFRIASDPVVQDQRLRLAGSVCSAVRDAGVVTSVNDLSEDFGSAPECASFGLSAMLVSPVFGPDAGPVGLLALCNRSRHVWNRPDATRLDDLAHLITQELILKASFETLHLMRRERGAERPALAH